MVDAGIRPARSWRRSCPACPTGASQITATVRAIRTPAARCRHAHPVYLRGATREHFMGWLRRHDPALHARYERGLNKDGEVEQRLQNLGA